MPISDAIGESVADLVLRIIADVSQYEKEMKRAGETLDKTVTEGEERIKKYGKEAENALKKVIHRMYDINAAMEGATNKINQVGFSALKTATIMVGPFVAAMVKVRNTNQQVALQFGKINDAVDLVANTMADVAIPYLETFADFMARLSNKIAQTNPGIKKLIGHLVIFRGTLYAIRAGLLFLLGAFIKFTWALAKFTLTILAFKAITTFLASSAGILFLAKAFSTLSWIALKVGWAVGYFIGMLIKLPFILIAIIKHTAMLIPKLLLLGKTMLLGVAIGFKVAMGAVIGFFAALGPVGWALIALGALITVFTVAWVKNWGNIRQVTENVLIWIGNALNVAIDFWTLKLNWLKVEATRTFQFWKNIMKGPTEAMRIANEEAEKLAKSLSENFEKSKLDLVAFADTVSQKVNELSEKVTKAWADMFAGDKNKVLRDMGAGFTNGLKDMAAQFSDWGATIRNLAAGFASDIQGAFAEFFFDLFTGELKSAEEYFANFGRAIVQAIVNLIAQLMALWVVVQMINLLPGGPGILKALDLSGMVMGGSKHEGGEVKHEGGSIGTFGVAVAHAGMAVDDRMIRAQVGEGILSRNGMAAIGGAENLNKINAGEGNVGGSPIYLIQNIKAWDASDVIRNKKALAAGMIEEIMNNGALRGVIKRYT